MSDAPPPRPTQRSSGDYVKALFHNVYNYTLLGGVATVAVLTGQWWLLPVGLAAEGLYMLWAPSSKFMRRQIDKQFEEEDRKLSANRREQMLSALNPRDFNRCQTLLLKEAEIRRLAEENQSFERSMLERELDKLSRLADDFVSLADSSTRLRAYLDKQRLDEVERQQRNYQKQAESASDPAQRDLAKKNLDILMRRLERLRDIKEFVSRASGELDLIENSFALLADQIVSMRGAGEFGGQLDDLIDGVDAVRQAAGVAERLSEEIR
ncbi:MAG: hypothetical protein JXR83_21880 [Deltaproteobacteria bacterium]|nr:hypothetical protein [Deltaproteobacteria bacterium]